MTAWLRQSSPLQLSSMVEAAHSSSQISEVVGGVASSAGVPSLPSAAHPGADRAIHPRTNYVSIVARGVVWRAQRSRARGWGPVTLQTPAHVAR